MREPRTQESTERSTGHGGIGRLVRRADFLRAAKGKRWHAGGMTVQASPAEPDKDGVRVGFTLTRKVGSAVVRNRVRRRLKEAVRLSSGLPVKHGHDYVIIGRIEALRLSFETLKRELDRALRAVHDAGPGGRKSKDCKPKDRKSTGTVPAP